MTLTISEVRKQSTHRPETEALASFLNQIGIEAETEHPVPMDRWRCRDCGKQFEFWSEADKHEDDSEGSHEIEEMSYYLDVYLHKFKISIESQGKIHEKASVQKKDEKRKDFLESLGIKVCEIPSSFLLTKNELDYDKIEKLALLVKVCLEK